MEEAYPGDIVALVNATDVRVGDTLYAEEPVEFPRLPEFAPEHFTVARASDTGRFKQFRKGIAQLDEEGVVQVLRDRDTGDQAPVLAAVGPMQLEVALWRLEHEFGAPTELSPTALLDRPEDRRGVGGQAAVDAGRRPCWPGPTARSTPCSSRPTGWPGSSRRTPTSPSTASWPRARPADASRPAAPGHAGPKVIGVSQADDCASMSNR